MEIRSLNKLFIWNPNQQYIWPVVCWIQVSSKLKWNVISFNYLENSDLHEALCLTSWWINVSTNKSIHWCVIGHEVFMKICSPEKLTVGTQRAFEWDCNNYKDFIIIIKARYRQGWTLFKHVQKLLFLLLR